LGTKPVFGNGAEALFSANDGEYSLFNGFLTNEYSRINLDRLDEIPDPFGQVIEQQVSDGLNRGFRLLPEAAGNQEC